MAYRPASQPAFQPIAGLAVLADRYDAFILDIWGVLMDGVAPYPGAAQALDAMGRAHKRLILLSNAPRVPARVAERLAAMEMPPDLYDQIVSSGGACRTALARRQGPFADFGDSYLLIGPDRDRGLLDGLPYRPVTELDEAGFVLVLGPYQDHDSLDAYGDLLRRAKTRDLPMLCANPDKVIVRQNGDRILCAGAIAESYEAIGGTVYSFGKPLSPIYEACFAALEGIGRKRILAVGDNLETDIAGAAGVGLATALVTGGILAERLGTAWGTAADPEKVAGICGRDGPHPDYLLPVFRW